MWEQYEKGKNINTIGPEQGIIIKDEEFNKCCRITIEKCEKYYAITCGIYGFMVHTAFVDEKNYITKYNDMKLELQEFLDKETSEKEYDNFCKEFTNKY